MTRYKNINSGAQYNLFAEEKSVEKEVIADFEVKPAKAPTEEKKGNTEVFRHPLL